MKLLKTLAVISTAEASMPYYSKCRAIEMKKAGIKVPKKYIIDNGEDCDDAMARNEDDEDYRKPILWKNNWSSSENRYIVPYYFEEGYENIRKRFEGDDLSGEESLDKINEDAEYFGEHTCIKLVEIHDRDEVENWESRIYIDSGEGPAWDCGAGAGMEPGDVPMHMGIACAYERGITVHEFMHNLGFEHEFQRPDRHLFIGVHPSLDDFDYQLLEEDMWHGDLNTPYDWKSALNYGVHEMDDEDHDEGRYNIHLAGDPDEPAPISRHNSRGGMSDGDIYRINFAYDCDVNDKCADAGPDACNVSGLEGDHECLNQPRGFNCNCAAGFIAYDAANNEQRCYPDYCAAAPEDRCGGQEHECINESYGLRCGCTNGLVEMYDEANRVWTCETDFCAEAGPNVCGGVPSQCSNMHSLQDYICSHCPTGYDHSRDGKCVITFDQQITVINDAITELMGRIPDKKYNQKWEGKMSQRIGQLEEATNEDKSRCDPTSTSAFIIAGVTESSECELAAVINAALLETTEEWICGKKESKKFTKQFPKLLKQFNKKNC